MDYISITFHTSDEIVQAFISQLSFESFEEQETAILGFLPVAQYDDEFEQTVKTLAQTYGITFEKKVVKGQNWNSIWESNFEPISVGDFCYIRAEFHLADNSKIHEIIINPKMAFGTGHHETTFMMIEQMRSLDFNGRRVFDYGCGTGILAILAEKMGAKYVLGVEIEKDAVVNTQENMVINQTEHIVIREGDIKQAKSDKFDVILANINRNVLLESASDLIHLLNEDGVVLLSGILRQDADLIVSKFRGVGLLFNAKVARGEWICLKLSREK